MMEAFRGLDNLVPDGTSDAATQAPDQGSFARKAQELLLARQGQDSGAQVEQQMADYNQKNPRAAKRASYIANGIAQGGEALQGAPPNGGMQAPQAPVVHPETYAKFSQWLEQFQKTGGQV